MVELFRIRFTYKRKKAKSHVSKFISKVNGTSLYVLITMKGTIYGLTSSHTICNLFKKVPFDVSNDTCSLKRFFNLWETKVIFE